MTVEQGEKEEGNIRKGKAINKRRRNGTIKE